MTQMTDYSKTITLLWKTNSQIAEGHESHLMPISNDKKQNENIKPSARWIYACNKSRKLVLSITMLKLQNMDHCCQTETSRTILNLSFCTRKCAQCPSVVLPVIVRSDRAWMGSCPSAASWWAAIMRALWCYGALPAITTATIRGFLSPPEWRISWWISWIAPWTISWIIVAARPSTFMITWVCWLTRTPYAPYTQVLARGRCPCSLPLRLQKKLETSVEFISYHWYGNHAAVLG
jgi:hypothetical protein